MFEAVTFTNVAGPGPLVDVGSLAESLLFYSRVAVVGNTGTLKDLLARVPPFILLRLLEDKRLEFYYLADQIAVFTNEVRLGEFHHELVKMSSPEHTIETIAAKAFREASGYSEQSKIGSRKFERAIRPLDHGSFDQAVAYSALSDPSSSESATAALLRVAAPGYAIPNPLRFRMNRETQGFIVDTNIDFESLNKCYHRIVPVAHSSMSKAYILSLLQTAQEDMYFSATLNSEMVAGSIREAIQSQMLNTLLQRRMQSENQLSAFVDLTLDSSHAIREAVNSGNVSFADILRLLDKADKFRHWLSEQSLEADLVKAYYREITHKTWVERLPAKTTRWSIFTGAGIALDVLGAGGLGTAAAAGIGAFDTFVLDKILQGWKPHQFVEGDLKHLFAKQDQV